MAQAQRDLGRSTLKTVVLSGLLVSSLLAGGCAGCGSTFVHVPEGTIPVDGDMGLVIPVDAKPNGDTLPPPTDRQPPGDVAAPTSCTEELLLGGCPSGHCRLEAARGAITSGTSVQLQEQ